MKKLLFIAAFFTLSLGFAQEAKIKGYILDGENNQEALAFANILVKNTNYNTTSDIDGSFELNVASGSYTIVVYFVGYEPIEIENVVVHEGKTILLNKTLKAKQVALYEEITYSN